MNMGKVYFLTNGENIKIGHTKGNVIDRLKQLNTGSDMQLYLLGYINGDQKKEKELHSLFSNIKIRNNGEWFFATDKLIDYINEINEKTNTYVIKNELYNNKVMAVLKI